MKNGLVYLIAGFATTLVAILVMFLISTHGGSNIKFVGPYVFGNVMIWQKKEKEISDKTYNSEMLYIAKLGFPI